MKYFLSLFLLFLSTLLPIHPTTAQVDLYGPPPTQLVKWTDTLTKWEIDDYAPLSGQRGYGPWHTFDGGRTRFVSCTAGIPQNTVLLTGIQVILDDNVTLQKPTIQTDFAAKETKILYPLQNPLPAGESRTNQYQNITFFPIIFNLNEPDQPIHIPATVTLPIIKNNHLTTHTLPLTLDLEPMQTPLTTNVCAALMDTLQKTPQPARTHVTGLVYQPNATQIDLHLTFDFEPTTIAIQLDNEIPLQRLYQKIAGNTASFQFKTNRFINPMERLNFKILTNKHWYDLPLTIQSAPAAISTTQTGLNGWTIIWLILLSPFWIFLLFTAPEKIRLHAFFELLCAFPAAIMFYLLILHTTPLWLTYPNALQTLVAAGISLYLLKRTRTPLLSLPILLILITPYPFLINGWLEQSHQPYLTQLMYVISIITCLCMPLILGLICPTLITKIQRYRHIFLPRLPFALLTGWLMLASVLIPINKLLPTCSTPSDNTLSLSVYTNPTGWKTAWHNLFAFPFQPYRTWAKKNDFTLCRGTLNTDIKTYPTYVLKKGNQSLITIEHPISNHQLIQMIKGFIPPPDPAP